MLSLSKHEGLSDLPNPISPGRHAEIGITATQSDLGSGEFAEWTTWTHEPFDMHAGPFHHKHDNDGKVVCAFRAHHHHTNALGVVHGGCLLSLADYFLFVSLLDATGDKDGVTVSLNSEFIGAARQGDLVEARGEVLKVGRSMVFLRGLISAADRPLVAFSGTMKRLRAPASSRSTTQR